MYILVAIFTIFSLRACDEIKSLNTRVDLLEKKLIIPASSHLSDHEKKQQ